jgi:signal transduction histidine kinase
VSLGRLHKWWNAGVVSTLVFVVLAAAVAALTVGDLSAAEPETVDPTTRWPWFPGRPETTLIVFVGAQLLVGLAAFIRRPRSGVAQALLCGSAANAAASIAWTGVDADQLGAMSRSWLAFLAAGSFTLVLWSSLVHIVLVFPTRDRRLSEAAWVVPALYLVPQLLLIVGAFAIGALTPVGFDWLDRWPRVHAFLVSFLLLAGIAGMYFRVRDLSVVRRRQIRWVVLAAASAAAASLVLIELPIVVVGAPIVSRSAVVLLALPIPVLLAVALWQDRNFRLDRLRQSQMELLHAREEERRRLRRDLHDGLGPTLAAIGLKVDAAASWTTRDPQMAQKLLADVRQDLAAAVADTRRLVRGLRPPALGNMGLVDAVQKLAGGFVGEGAPRIVVAAPDGLDVPAAIEVAGYRIIQEGITNAVRHSSAKRVDVRMATKNGHFRIDVIDDGVGFSPSATHGTGTESMRERAEELGGDYSLRSDGSGTRLVVVFPLAPN